MSRDIIIVEDEKEKVVFHFAIFCEQLKECIAKYGNIHMEQAELLVKRASFFIFRDINCFTGVVYFSHERSFHWAMIILYGNNYWHTHPEYATNPKDYDAWETMFLARYHLSDCYEFETKE